MQDWDKVENQANTFETKTIIDIVAHNISEDISLVVSVFPF